MNRAVSYLNLLGVLALAILCVAQWQRNRSLNLEFNRLEKTHFEEQQKIEEQEKNRRGLTADLAILKDQISQTHSNLTESRATATKAETEILQLRRERTQLQESVTNWSNAVALRDERLKEANDQISSLSLRLNESVSKFNSLASNHNAVVQRLEEVRRMLESKAAPTK